MKKILCVLVGLTFCAGAYAGDATVGDMDIFFSTDANIEFKAPGAPDLGDIGGAGTQTLYVYANIDINDFKTWNGLGLDIAIDGGTYLGGELYNPNMGATPPVDPLWPQYEKYRWQNGAISGSRPYNPIPSTVEGYLNASAVSGGWLINLGALPSYGDYGTGPNSGDELAYSDYQNDAGDITWTGTYLLGEIWFTGDAVGGINLGVSPAWNTQTGDTAPWATLAFGLNGPVDGRLTGAGLDNVIYDATFTPEPASLLLMALGALIIRRR